MAILFRLLAGAGLLALGYYVGREVGRLEPIREELRRARGRPGQGSSEELERTEARTNQGNDDSTSATHP